MSEYGDLRSILARGYQPAPWERGGYSDPYEGATLRDLMGRQGQIQAQRQRAGGDMLAQGFQNAFAGVADYFGKREEKKELDKRNEATLAAIQSWDGKDPMQLFAGMQKVRGPQDALQYTNAVLALRSGERKNPEQEIERLGKIAQFMTDQPDEVVARGWPMIRQSFAGTAERLGIPLPEQWDPKERQVLGKIGEVFGPKKEGRKLQALSPGQVAFDEATGEIVARAPEKPAEKKVHTLSPGAMMVDESGAVLAKAPNAPREPKEEQLVQVDVGGVPTWVPKSEAVGKPAAQAPRAVTGAERQSLAYYNRGKQALEDIEPLEKAIAGKNLAGQARLEYAPNWLQSPENQQYRQAQRAFTEARLRKESGAAIPQSEFDNDSRTYFAQPGDTEATLKQKKAARERVLQGMGYASGKAYEEHYGERLATPANSGAPRPSSGPPEAKSAAERDALPPGTVYRGPDGKLYRKR